MRSTGREGSEVHDRRRGAPQGVEALLELTVTDTVSGLVKTYTNELGSAFQPIQDLGAFATCPATDQVGPSDSGLEAASELDNLLTALDPAKPPVAASLSFSTLSKRTLMERQLAHLEIPTYESRIDKSPGACVPDATTLCLSGGRFEVTALWDTGQQIGDGHAIELTGDTGYYRRSTTDVDRQFTI